MALHPFPHLLQPLDPGLTLALSPRPWGLTCLPAPLSPGVRAAGPSSSHTLSSSCAHGKLSCSVGDCSKAAGGFGPWGPWGSCSRSCGGLGTRTRSRQCVHPTPAPSGQGCRGPRWDLEYCLSPECPGEGRGAGWEASGWPFVPSCLSIPVPTLGLAQCFSSVQTHSTKFLELLPNVCWGLAGGVRTLTLESRGSDFSMVGGPCRRVHVLVKMGEVENSPRGTV